MKTIQWIAIIIILLCVALYIGYLYIHAKMHDADVPRQVVDQRYKSMTVMTFFPHPDDEVSVFGTLNALKDEGARIILVCLTRGEAGPTGGLTTQENLGEWRTTELEKVAQLLRADALHIMDLPDGKLLPMHDTLKLIARNMVAQYQPELVITYDHTVGFYGHPDHVAASLAMHELYQDNKASAGFPIKQLWQVTLCKNQIDIAMKISPTFQKRYPKDGSKGLPAAHFYHYTQPYFPLVKQAMALHASQREVFKNILPYSDQVPEVVYSRLFGREYFHVVE